MESRLQSIGSDGKIWVPAQVHFHQTANAALDLINFVLKKYEEEAVPIVKQLQHQGAGFEAMHLTRLCQKGFDYTDADNLSKSNIQDAADGLDKCTGLWFRWFKRQTPALFPSKSGYRFSGRLSISPVDVPQIDLIRQYGILQRVVRMLESNFHSIEFTEQSVLQSNSYSCARCITGSCFSKNTFAKIDPLIFRVFKFCSKETNARGVVSSFLQAAHAVGFHQLTRENGDSFLQVVLQLDDVSIEKTPATLLSELERFVITLLPNSRGDFDSTMRYKSHTRKTILQHAMSRASESETKVIIRLYRLFGLEINECILMSPSDISALSSSAARILPRGCNISCLMLAILHQNYSAIGAFLTDPECKSNGSALVRTEILGKMQGVGPFQLACMMNETYPLDALHRLFLYQRPTQAQLFTLFDIYALTSSSQDEGLDSARWLEIFGWFESDVTQVFERLKYIEQLRDDRLPVENLKSVRISAALSVLTQHFKMILSTGEKDRTSSISYNRPLFKLQGPTGQTEGIGAHPGLVRPEISSSRNQDISSSTKKMVPLSQLPPVLQSIRQKIEQERSRILEDRRVVSGRPIVPTGLFLALGRTSTTTLNRDVCLEPFGTRSSFGSVTSGRSSITSIRTTSSGRNSFDDFVFVGHRPNGYRGSSVLLGGGLRDQDVMEIEHEVTG